MECLFQEWNMLQTWDCRMPPLRTSSSPATFQSPEGFLAHNPTNFQLIESTSLKIVIINNNNNDNDIE